MDSSAVSSATADETVLIPSLPNSGSTDDCNTLEKHPLMIPLIVGKIVKQLDPSFEQFKTLRLVCKTWTEATLHHWRKSCAVLTLIPDPAPRLFTASKHYKKGLPVCKFFKEFQDPQSPFQLSTKPFSKYKFKGVTFDVQVCFKTGGQTQTFWNSIGPHIESLYFENCIFLKPRSEKKVTCPMTQLLVTMIPNVKHLVLSAVVIQQAKKSKKAQDDLPLPAFIEKPNLSLLTLTVYDYLKMENESFKDLFKMAPHLASIKGMDAPTNSMTKVTLMKLIYEVRFDGKPGGICPLSLSNLKHVDLINADTFLEEDEYSWLSLIPPLMKNMATIFPQLPLETLTLHIEVLPFTVDILATFQLANEVLCLHLNKYLLSLSGTLKTLKLYRAPVGPPYLKFLSGASGASEMSLLTELDLWGTIAPDFGFLKSTPNLKRLTINLGCFEKRGQLKAWITEHYDDYRDKAKYQKYKEDMVAKVPTHWKQGGRGILCTELEYLEVDFEFPEESLRILGKWTPNLKTLKTVLNGRTIPVVCEVWRELTELVCLHGSQIGDKCLIRDEETCGFSGAPLPELKICDLNDLERFQLDTYCGESELSENAIYNGFLKMPGLKYVHFCINDWEMSEKAEEALRKGVQSCEIIRNGIDGKEICVCDRCVFRSEAEKGFLEFDDEDYAEDDENDEENDKSSEDASGDSDGSGESEEF